MKKITYYIYSTLSKSSLFLEYFFLCYRNYYYRGSLRDIVCKCLKIGCHVKQDTVTSLQGKNVCCLTGWWQFVRGGGVSQCETGCKESASSKTSQVIHTFNLCPLVVSLPTSLGPHSGCYNSCTSRMADN